MLKRITTNPVDKCKKWLAIIVYFSAICEMIFFPTLENLCGCAMTILVWLIFSTFFFKYYIIVQHPFSFMIYLSMFLARFIPLPATLLEGKPISYGFEVPLETFFYETIIFIICSIAFFISLKINKKGSNLISRTFYKLNLFQTTPSILWIMGFIGLVARIQKLILSGTIEYGDSSNKLLAGLEYLQYAPIIMLFPKLSRININKNHKIIILSYIVILIVVSFATNSRQAMIYPIFTLVLLLFLYILKERINLSNYISPQKFLIIGILCFFILNLFSDISIAMLANRDGRDQISRLELFKRTFQTLQNREEMTKLRNISLEEKGKIISYNQGWDETYLDNFMLNRYGNLRVTDQTLYYANKIGYGNKQMQESFWNKTLAILPTPFLEKLNIKINKNEMEYSSGDMLYLIGSGTKRFALGGYRVTTLVADGLSTFGYYSFVMIFIMLILTFKLLDCFVIYKNNKIIYSTIALINIFGFIGIYRNSIGLINMVSYLTREFWQILIIYIVIFHIYLYTTKIFKWH